MMDILWQAYQEGGSHLVEGGRGTCKTLGMAILGWWMMVEDTKEEFKNIGGSGDQSQHCIEYLRSFLLSTPASRLIDGDALKKRVKMKDGSSATVLTHSQTSARGSHPTFLGADEVDEMAWDIIQAYLGSGARAHTRFFCSTSQNPTGPMQRMKEELHENGFTYHKTTYFEALKCDRDSCAECIAATKNNGEVSFHDFCKNPDGTYKAKLADGFLTVEMALDQWRSMDYRTALAELFCEGAKSEGLVYYNFNVTVNVMACDYDDQLPVCSGWDFGFENPTVALLFQVTKDDQVRVIREVRARRQGALAANMAASFKEMHRDIGAPFKLTDGYGDPAGAQQIAELRQQGINITSAKMRGQTNETRRGRTPRARKPLNRKEQIGGVEGSVSLLNRLFDVREDGKPGLIIDPTCRETIRELGSVIYIEGTDKIKKEHDHGPDALRYGVWSIMRGMASDSHSRASGGGLSPVPAPTIPEATVTQSPTRGRW